MKFPKLSIGPEGGVLLVTGVFAVVATLFMPFDLITFVYYFGYASLAGYFAYKYKRFLNTQPQKMTSSTLKDPAMYAIWFDVACLWQILGVIAYAGV